MAGFDPTLKVLVDASPEGWLTFLGRAVEPVEVADTDLSVVNRVADKVLKVGDRDPYICHLEFAAGKDSADLPRELNTRAALLELIHRCGVKSTVIVLKPEADSPQLTGRYERRIRDEPPHGYLKYDVVRVWTEDVERFLTGSPVLVPLAPLAAVAPGDLPDVVRRMDERLRRPDAAARAADLWTATRILMGLRYSEDETDRLLRGVLTMEESVTYQAILRDGRIAEAQGWVSALGTSRFGPPSARESRALAAITDHPRLVGMRDRILTATSWADLLGLPAPRRRRNPTAPRGES